MNKFLQSFFFAISLLVISNVSAASPTSAMMSYDFCYNHPDGKQESITSTMDMTLFNFNCLNPMDNFTMTGALTNQNFNNGGVYGDFYFLVTLTGNQRAVITISGANAVMQEIGPCTTPAGGATDPLIYCTAGVYKIRVQNTNGTAAATFTANITITTLQVASITRTETSGSTNNDGILCEGGNVSLQTVMSDPTLTGLTYSWAGPNGYADTGNPVNINPVNSTHTGTYTVTVTDANMCTTTFNTTLTVNPLPEFTINDTETSGTANNDENVCVGDPFTLTPTFTVGSGATYAWAFPGGTSNTNPLVIASASIASHNGTFNLTVTDANGCTNTANIVMSIDPLPTVSNTTLKACAIATGSNQGDFVLEDANEADNYPTNQNDGTDVDNGAGGVTVTYHASQAAANAGTGAISSGLYTNGTIVWARVENDATGCHAVAQVTLEVIALPAKSNTELRSCADPNNAGSADFTLTDAQLAPAFPAGNSNVTADIDNGNGGLTITYHPTLGDAQNNTSETFSGPYPNGTTVFARIYNPTTTCFDVATVLLTVLPLPVANDTELRECEMPAGSNQAMFTLTEAQLPPGFPTTNSNVTADVDNGTAFTVTFHSTQAGAENNTNQIGTTGNFANATTVFARVENPATECAGVAEILLTVLPAPTPEIQYEGSPSNFTICAGEAFDLNVVSPTGTAPFTYNWTLPSGTGSGNPYSVGSAVVATHNGAWVVTVTDANGCTGTDNINITVTPAPANGSCGSAINVGTGFSALPLSGTTVCAPTGGPCAGPDNESAVYFTYTVPPEGLTRLRVNVPGFNVSIGPGCGSGNCEPDAAIIECPDPGSTIFITVSSSEAGEGAFNGQVLPAFEPPPVTGTVFVDLDIDGTFGGGDIGLANVSIAAFPNCDKSTTPITATTDANGNFTFAPGSLTVPPLTYLIMIDPNSTIGCDANVAECIELDPCENTLDAILFPCPPPNCEENPFSYGNDCDGAYENPLCDLRVIGQFPCGQNPSEIGPWSPSPHCNGVYHNTSFYGFVAGSGDYNIEFTIFNCAGTGVQYGVMDACSPGGPFIVCDGGATGNGQTVTISSDLLTPCTTYIFWIDGWAGSVCSYYANVTGDWNNCSVPDIEDIRLNFPCQPLCPSLNPVTMTAIPEPNSIPPIEQITGAVYNWSVSGPGGVSEYTIEGPEGITLEHIFAEAGTYTVCLSTYHPCDGDSPDFCKTFTFENIEDDYMDFKICTADFPWTGAIDPANNNMPLLDKHKNQWAWFGGEITLQMVRSGNYNYSSVYENACGCTYNQAMRITEVRTGVGKQDIAICQNEIPYTYRDTTFRTEVTDFPYVLDIKTKNGCDSIVNITTRILNMGGTINDVCVQGGFDMTFNMGLAFINAERDSIKYIWRNSAGNVIADNNADPTNIFVTAVGTYSLEIQVFKFGKSCSFNFNRTIDLTGRLPLAPIADNNWPLKICEDANTATYNVLTPNPNLIYLWTVPATATKIKDDSTGTLIVRWNGPTGGIICVKARNLCGDGPETCLPVVYVDMIDPDFSMIGDICKGNATPIVATSTHTAVPVVYNWGFDGGNPDLPTNNGPGPHNVRWASAGTKTVSLFVSENGCVGDPITKTINVAESPAPPQVSCGSTTSSSVSFTWDDVPGATSYTVNIIDPIGITGTLVPGQNRFEVTGLALGQSVTITVTAVIPPPCGNVTSLPQECTAQNCDPIPSVTINSILDICLPGSPINLNASLVTVNPTIAGANGTFTVNGTAATVFNPAALGAGNHIIRYTYSWDNNRCSIDDTETVKVSETPSSDFTVGPGGCVLDPVTVTYTGGTTGALYTWNFGPDVIGTFNGTGPHNVRWTNPGQKTITLTVSKDGCTSIVTTKRVTVNPVLTTPTVSCTDRRIDGVTFGWDAVANVSGYTITVQIVGGAVLYTGTVTNTSYDVSSIPEGTEVRITVTAIASNGCPNTSSTVVCKATSCPDAIISFPALTITECLTSSLAPIPLNFTIKDNIPGEVPTVRWSSISPISNAAINNSTTPATFNPQTAGVGNHIIVLSYKQRLCEWKDSILITLRPVPQASFTAEDKICITDPLLVNYTGTNTGGRMLTWDDGGATRLDLTSTSVSYTFPQPGTYTIGVTTSLNGCTSTKFTKPVVVEAIPAPPVITCTSTLNSVTFSWTAITCATEFDVEIDGVSRGRQTARTFAVTGLMEGDKAVIDLASLSTCECPIPAATLTCEAKRCPPVNITLQASQLSTCLVPNVGKITITATVTGNTPDGKGTWSGKGVGANGLFDPAVAGVGTHEITYRYIDETCPFERKISIKVNELPRIIWEVVNPRCYSDLTGSFNFTIEGGTPPYTTTVDGRLVTGSPAAGITSGNHTFVVKDVNGCEATQTFAITIPVQPSFTIKGAAIVNLGKQATHTLDLSGMQAFINVVDSVVWLWNGKRVCSGNLTTCSSVTNIPPKGPNEYEVFIYYNNGCRVTAKLSYVVVDLYEYWFPNIINPYTSNNQFKITAQDPTLFVKKMRVYDRWGNLVFISENFSATQNPAVWNGKWSKEGDKGGQDVVPGVYIYIFEMSNELDDNIVETGDVTVIR